MLPTTLLSNFTLNRPGRSIFAQETRTHSSEAKAKKLDFTKRQNHSDIAQMEIAEQIKEARKLLISKIEYSGNAKEKDHSPDKDTQIVKDTIHQVSKILTGPVKLSPDNLEKLFSIYKRIPRLSEYDHKSQQEYTRVYKELADRYKISELDNPLLATIFNSLKLSHRGPIKTSPKLKIFFRQALSKLATAKINEPVFKCLKVLPKGTASMNTVKELKDKFSRMLTRLTFENNLNKASPEQKFATKGLLRAFLAGMSNYPEVLDEELLTKLVECAKSIKDKLSDKIKSLLVYNLRNKSESKAARKLFLLFKKDILSKQNTDSTVFSLITKLGCMRAFIQDINKQELLLFMHTWFSDDFLNDNSHTRKDKIALYQIRSELSMMKYNAKRLKHPDSKAIANQVDQLANDPLLRKKCDRFTPQTKISQQESMIQDAIKKDLLPELGFKTKFEINHDIDGFESDIYIEAKPIKVNIEVDGLAHNANSRILDSERDDYFEKEKDIKVFRISDFSNESVKKLYDDVIEYRAKKIEANKNNRFNKVATKRPA